MCQLLKLFVVEVKFIFKKIFLLSYLRYKCNSHFPFKIFDLDFTPFPEFYLLNKLCNCHVFPTRTNTNKTNGTTNEFLNSIYIILGSRWQFFKCSTF